MTESAETLQARYYEQSVLSYDSLHNASEEHEHNLALQYIEMISNAFGLRTFLDVGAGTGRGICFLRDRGKEVRGIEPVAAMIEKAELNGVPKGLLLQGSGYELPFEDGAFDAVFECGVLHHVADPARVVGEMLRVAKRAVFSIGLESLWAGSSLSAADEDSSLQVRFVAGFSIPSDQGEDVYPLRGRWPRVFL